MRVVEFPWGKVHFVGVGGVGMAGLATILAECEIAVSGSDMVDSDYTRQVEARGGIVAIGHNADNLPGDADLVVHSAAVPPDNPELMAARRRDIKCVVRGEFLAEMALAFPRVVAVAGSHGKTTTTALITHILREAGLRPGYMIGGEVSGLSASAAAGKGGVLVTEVDESDGTQALMRSAWGVVVNVEDDHCWNLGGLDALEDCFKVFAGKAEQLIAWRTERTDALFNEHHDITLLDEHSMPEKLKLTVPGEHNRINAALAIAVAQRLGVSFKTAIKAAASFPGVKRRMTHHFTTADQRVTIVEDYAHHPTELRVTLKTLRDTYPRHRLVAVFQPHRFERVKRYAGEFSDLLSGTDEVYVVRPFSAWLGDGAGVHPEVIAEGVRNIPAAYWGESPAELGKQLAADVRLDTGSATLFAILGAGDVCETIPALQARLTVKVLDQYQAELCMKCPKCVTHRLKTWAEYTTLGIGRAKPLVVEPADVNELKHALKLAKKHNLSVFFLGRGSNLVGTDKLLQQVVIRLSGPSFMSWSRHGRFIRAGAGLSMSKLFNELADHGFVSDNAAPLSWIPGAVGGAVRMNAGAGGVEIGRVVDRVTGVTTTGRRWEKRGEDVDWGYRMTDIPDNVCITEVLFRFERGDREKVLCAIRKIGEARKKQQPQGRSAGCCFRNAGEASAGKLLDTAGCKGLTVGDCMVSTEHANFFIAGAKARETDFLTLMRLAQRRVLNESGIVLQPEIIFINPESAKAFETNIVRPHIVVLQGGPSAEHDISMNSAAAVAAALRQGGLRVTQVDVHAAELPELPVDADVVFPVLHGEFGEDGGIQALLDERGIRYVGSKAESSAATMSKTVSKKLFHENGIPTPSSRVIESIDDQIPEGLAFPIVVKPVNQGSTNGLTVLKRPSGWWKRALKAAFALDPEVMAEEFVEGIEITVGLLEGEPLTVIEIVPPSGRIFDFDAKYDHKRGHTHYFCPPRNVSGKVCRKAQKIAVQVYEILNARDMLRVDMIVDRHGVPWVLEANSIPGFTSTSLLPMAARMEGITFPELCARLVMP